MPEDDLWEPTPVMIISDLGQLTAFGDPDQSRILRLLQRQEATAGEIGLVLDIPIPTVIEHLDHLTELVLVRAVVTAGSDGQREDVYRASARMFNLKPDPRDMGTISSTVGATMLDALSREITTSLSMWPDQKMNFEWRRTHLPLSQVMEFNDRLQELLLEYWGAADTPAKDDPNDPLMAFLGVWYRLAE